MAGAGNRARHFLRVAGSDRSDRGPDLAVGSRRDVRGGNEIVEDDVFLTVQGNMHPDGDIPLTRHIHARHQRPAVGFAVPARCRTVAIIAVPISASAPESEDG